MFEQTAPSSQFFFFLYSGHWFLCLKKTKNPGQKEYLPKTHLSTNIAITSNVSLHTHTYTYTQNNKKQTQKTNANS